MTSLAPAVPAPALEVANLSFAYAGKLALDDVSFGVPGGGFCVLVGANGAGKTTLFSIVTGLFSAGGGRVSVRGHDLVRDGGAALAELGVVFQQSTLDADLGVRQNLRYFAELHGLPGRIARERIDAALERHGLDAVGASKAGALSGGQRRRVELARALLHRPSLLLMDEPTVGLDMASRAEFVAHVRALCAEEGLGVLWATHLADEIEPADTVYLLERGRLVGRGVFSELLAEHGVGDMPALAATLAA